MKAEDIRHRLIFELQAQFSETGLNNDASSGPEEPVITFPSPTFEKPQMFMPKETGRLELETDYNIKGIGFADNSNSNQNPNPNSIPSKTNNKNMEIYSMKELIEANPANMQTIIYDENVAKKQLGLIKKVDWQDILFQDVDWFKPINVFSGIKKFFGKQ